MSSSDRRLEFVVEACRAAARAGDGKVLRSLVSPAMMAFPEFHRFLPSIRCSAIRGNQIAMFEDMLRWGERSGVEEKVGWDVELAEALCCDSADALGVMLRAGFRLREAYAHSDSRLMRACAEKGAVRCAAVLRNCRVGTVACSFAWDAGVVMTALEALRYDFAEWAVAMGCPVSHEVMYLAAQVPLESILANACRRPCVETFGREQSFALAVASSVSIATLRLMHKSGWKWGEHAMETAEVAKRFDLRAMMAVWAREGEEE